MERSSRDKGDFDSRRGRRRAGRRSSYEDKDNDPEDRVSKRTTRKRKSGDSFDAKVDYEKRSKMEERNSGELSFGRRSRNRNRGGNSEVCYYAFPGEDRVELVLLLLQCRYLEIVYSMSSPPGSLSLYYEEFS